MISRRRMVFQFTSLLDLLLVVLFAQYLDSYETAQREARAEQAFRAQAEANRRQAEADRQRAEVDRRIAQGDRVASEDLKDTVIALLSAAGTESVVDKIRKTAAFRKSADIWEVHISDQNTARVRMDGTIKAEALATNSPGEFANRLIALARDNGEPKDLVVVTLTWSNPEEGAINRVAAGIKSAVPRLQQFWGADRPKRVEMARVGSVDEESTDSKPESETGLE